MRITSIYKERQIKISNCCVREIMATEILSEHQLMELSANMNHILLVFGGIHRKPATEQSAMN